MKNIWEDSVYNENEFLRLSNLMLKELQNHLENSKNSTSKTINWNSPENELSFWLDFLNNGKKDDFVKEVLTRTIHVHNPKYIGHQVAAPAPITAITAMVSALLNNGMAVYEMGMAPSAIERVVTDEICKTIGYDKNSGGFLTSGGTLANLTALLSARKAVVKEDIWNHGTTKPLGILVCEEAHYCVDRAARIMGLGEKGIIKIPATSQFDMDTTLLEQYFNKALESGIEIFAIVGSAPSTATGAYDDLQKIAQFAQQKNIWFHVDGAHGGAAIYSQKYKHLVKGIENADSVVIDGHKMMLMPTITTALLFKNKLHAQHTFSQKADYLLTDTEEDQWYQSGKKTFECTKTMMSLHWFVLLKYYGVALFDEFVTRQYDLAKDFALIVDKHPNFELAVQPKSNILCFRYRRPSIPGEQSNEINARIREMILVDGEFYMVQTKLNGILYLRTTLMNPLTTIEHLKALLDKILAIATKISS